MREYLPSDNMVHTTASPSGPYRLFVSTPAGQTFSLRNLAMTVQPSELRAQLELVAGIPSDIYSLYYSSVPISNETELTFGDDVQNGALLSLRFDGDWGRLHEAVCRGNAREMERLCRPSSNGCDNLSTPNDASRNGVATGSENVSKMSDMTVDYSRFVAMFVSCHRGNFNLAKLLVRADPRLLEQTTEFSRTALHAAAAADRPKVLQLLLSSGARMYATDAFDQKPLDVATQLSCYLAERLLKYWVLRRRTAWGGDGSDLKCPERRSAERSHVRARTTSAPTIRPRTARTPGVRHVTLPGDQVDDGQTYDSRLNMWAETGMWAPTCNPGEPNGPCTDLLYETASNARSAKFTGRNTRVSRPTSFRAQSAKYYHGRFHKGDEDDFSREDRPATASSRFRAWKTWLVELDEREAEKQLVEEKKLERRERNDCAYRRWIAKKEREGDFERDDDDDNCSAITPTMTVSREVSSVAFQKWLEDKKQVLEEADRRRRESLRQAVDGHHERKVAYDRRVTVFEFRDTDPIAPRPSTPTDYICAYRNWVLKKRRHEALRAEDDDGDDGDDGGTLTREQVNDMRQVLVLDGMSHDEWLGQKERERVLGNRPLVLAPKRRTRPPGSQTVCIAVVAD